jgi:hypothetical protein
LAPRRRVGAEPREPATGVATDAGEAATALAPDAGRSRSPDSFAQQMRRVFVAFLLTRVALVAAGLAAPLFVPRPEGLAEIGPALLAMWARWDGPIYLTIAQEGYFLRDAAPVTAFFPLYPFLIQLLTLGADSREIAALAGVLISNVSLLVALGYLVALGRLDFGGRVGERAAIYYLVAPTTLFLSAVYTESLFLALFVGSFYHARRGEFGRSGILGLLAALARPYGALAAIPLAIEAVRRRRLPVWALAPLLGIAIFFAWLWLSVGDPLAWFEAQASFQRQLSPPWAGIRPYLEHPWSFFNVRAGIFDLAASVLLAGFTLICLRRLPPTYAATAGITTLLLLMSSMYLSMPRYALTVFPVFFLLASWTEDRRVRYALVAGSLAFAMYAMARFAQWQWVA